MLVSKVLGIRIGEVKVPQLNLLLNRIDLSGCHLREPRIVVAMDGAQRL